MAVSDHGKKSDLDNLIRVLSHQLKSPVNAIESLLTMILEGYGGDVDLKTAHYLKKAVSKTHEARQLISDLLHYEQFSGDHELVFERIDLAGMVAALCGRNCAISYETSADDWCPPNLFSKSCRALK